MKNRLLYLTADDYGMDSGIDRGILDCVTSGSIQNVSICDVASGNNLSKSLSVEAVSILKSASVGLHLCMFSAQTDINRPKDWIHTIKLFFPSPDFLAEKIEALDRTFSELEKLGLPCRFINGHQHVHLFPGWVLPLCEWAKKHNITVMRKPLELGLERNLSRIFRIPLLVLEFLGSLAEKLSRRHKMKWIPAICRWVHEINWQSAVSEIENVRIPEIEIVLHPGYPSEAYISQTGSPINYSNITSQLLQKNFLEIAERKSFSPGKF
ncbi:MAG: ChbG/HpnK family deacetylase [Candidatus Riflebacteria bacterium]|nr:ChbG/HpnK family deacetylase [Candidatus Riflebacteria bacterium]